MRRLLYLVLGAAALLLAAPVPAGAQAGERIRSFAIDVQVRPDGVLAVTELITYDFGANERRGILREIDTREPVDDDTDRLYRVSDVTVSSTTGAPADVDVQQGSSTTTIRIGDPDRRVTGRHSYVLRYLLHGHLNAFDDHDELFWQATGTGWSVPMSDVSVTVRTPGGLRDVRCLAGPPSSAAECDSARAFNEREAVFVQRTLDAGEGVTVVVGLDKGMVTVPPPELAERPVSPLRRLPSWAPFTAAGALVLGAAGFSALAWSRFGRDRKYTAVPLGLTPAPGQPATEEYVAITGEPEPAVAFVPPRGVRPALAGLLTAERAAPLQVSATIVDLAVRGYVRIDELPSGDGRSRDWRLVWRGQPPVGDELAPYEQALLLSLFRGEPAVLLSQLRGRFAPSVRHICGQLADEGLRAGWFRRRPPVAGQATFWKVGCVLAVVTIPFLGVSGLVGAVLLGWPALVLGAGVVVAAVIVALTVRAMPARTALGRAVWAQVQGFRRYLATAEAEQLRDDEAANAFTRYLPYAMIFGLTERWARVLGELGVDRVDVDWYSGPALMNLYWLGPAMTEFSTTSTSTLSYDPSSSASGGSGFSSGGSVGGGSGGGGGGSW
jgi:hypothetical protein